MKLFKYCSLSDYSLSNLYKSEYYYNSIRNVNDPFEFNIKINADDGYVNEMLRLVKGSDVLDEFQDGINISESKYPDSLTTREKNNLEDWMSYHIKNLFYDMYGITCFTDTNKSIQMWGHYADSFKGICLEFDIDKKFENKLVKVEYRNNPIAINLKENSMKDEKYPFVEDFLDFFRYKHKDWEYEREYRLVSGTQNSEKYPTKSLKAIYFGVNCPIEKQVEIYQKTMKHQHIQYYYMLIPENKFEIEFIRLKREEIERKIK